MSIFFSIVVPLYNKEKYIKKTLDSVLSQTHENFELIVIDDGSTDRSVEVVKEYKDERIKLFSQKNGGVSSARNTGITKSKYDLIALLDADDWWSTEYLEKMKNLILKYPTANLYALEYFRVFNGRLMPSMGVLNEGVDDEMVNPVIYGIRNGALPMHTSSVVIRKAILEKTGVFDERMSFFEDYDLFLRIISFGKIAYGKNGGAYYNIDVNPADKLTGKLPPISKHFMSYTSKLEPFLKNDSLLKLFVDRFIITAMVTYHRAGTFKSDLAHISSGVATNSYYLKDKFLLRMPAAVADFVVRTKMKLNELMKKDLY